MAVAEKQIDWTIHIDECDNGLIKGWVLDRNRPDVSVSIDIFSTGGKKTTVLANIYRSDLFEAGLGNGHHAFTVDIEGWDLPGHTIDIFPAGIRNAKPLRSISTELAESIMSTSWSSQFCDMLNRLAMPFAVTHDAK